MKVVLIGAGSVATQLALALHRYKVDIIQVYSRTLGSANLLASQLGAKATDDIRNVSTKGDFYIFSVKDSILHDLIIKMPPNKGLWLHTAGGISISVFDGVTNRFGVFYPFQTFSKNRIIEWNDIPIFVEASDEDTLQEVKNLATILSTKVVELSSDRRKYIHLSGVFACNFVNYMYTLSSEIVEEIGVPFDFVLPLIEETCAKVHNLSPMEAQTGPAIRFDENVIKMHVDLINDDKDKMLYKLISQAIYEKHKD